MAARRQHRGPQSRGGGEPVQGRRLQPEHPVRLSHYPLHSAALVRRTAPGLKSAARTPPPVSVLFLSLSGPRPSGPSMVRAGRPSTRSPSALFDVWLERRRGAPCATCSMGKWGPQRVRLRWGVLACVCLRALVSVACLFRPRHVLVSVCRRRAAADRAQRGGPRPVGIVAVGRHLPCAHAPADGARQVCTYVPTTPAPL